MVRKQIASIADPARREALVARLVPPTFHSRTWSYGPGHFQCWVVARDSTRGIVLVHATGAFSDPWGCLDAHSDDLGMDSDWFASLDDAFIQSTWDGPLPPGYVVS